VVPCCPTCSTCTHLEPFLNELGLNLNHFVILTKIHHAALFNGLHAVPVAIAAGTEALLAGLPQYDLGLAHSCVHQSRGCHARPSLTAKAAKVTTAPASAPACCCRSYELALHGDPCPARQHRSGSNRET